MILNNWTTVVLDHHWTTMVPNYHRTAAVLNHQTVVLNHRTTVVLNHHRTTVVPNHHQTAVVLNHRTTVVPNHQTTKVQKSDAKTLDNSAADWLFPTLLPSLLREQSLYLVHEHYDYKYFCIITFYIQTNNCFSTMFK